MYELRLTRSARKELEALPLTDEQKAELDRRLAEYEADPSGALPMDKVLEDIRARFRRT